MRQDNAVDETQNLGNFLEGCAVMARLMGDQMGVEKFGRAAYWLKRTSDVTCGQGYIGCRGGRECASDHK